MAKFRNISGQSLYVPLVNRVVHPPSDEEGQEGREVFDVPDELVPHFAEQSNFEPADGETAAAVKAFLEPPAEEPDRKKSKKDAAVDGQIEGAQ